MNSDDYARVQSVLSLPYGACPAASWIRKTIPTVKEEAWLAIYSQEQQYKVIRSHHLHKANVLHYLKRYGQGEDVLALAADVDFPPCMLLRRMLEQLVEGPKQLVTEVLRHPERLDASLCPGLPPDMLARMRVDVVRCVHTDCCYSPLSDVAKQVTGLEYELYLQKRLAEAGLAFWTEGELRTMGFHKTPDCKLKVPVAVRGRAGSEHLVCWVDSKATFGDSRTHVKQVEEQYRTYVNRYGPGMVIYWFGYVEDLNTDPHVLLCDDFPDSAAIIKITDALTLTPQLQQQQQPAAATAAGAVAAGVAAAPATAPVGAGAVRTGGLGAVLGVGGRAMVPASPSKIARRVSGMAEVQAAGSVAAAAAAVLPMAGAQPAAAAAAATATAAPAPAGRANITALLEVAGVATSW